MCHNDKYTLAVIKSSLIVLKGQTTILIPGSGNLAKYPGLIEVMNLRGECKTTKLLESKTEFLMFILIPIDIVLNCHQGDYSLQLVESISQA